MQNSTEKKRPMIRLTKKEWAAIHPDFKCVWTRPDTPEWVGRKCVLSACLGIYDNTLAIEGVTFEIV